MQLEMCNSGVEDGLQKLLGRRWLCEKGEVCSLYYVKVT
jgi:hypothetical protein